MKSTNYIAINSLCDHYEIEISFFNQLNEIGMLEIVTIEHSQCIHTDKIKSLEKMIRLNKELHINIEGIDTVFNLLDKIEDLQLEIFEMKQKLNRLED